MPAPCLHAPNYVRRRSRRLGAPFSRKHLKNAGRQRSSRFGYLLPLVLLRNSLADYTALISTTLALCPGLWEGSSPPPPPPPRRVIVGKTHLERSISTRFKNTPGATFSSKVLSSFCLFLWADSPCRAPAFLEIPGMNWDANP